MLFSYLILFLSQLAESVGGNKMAATHVGFVKSGRDRSVGNRERRKARSRSLQRRLGQNTTNRRSRSDIARSVLSHDGGKKGAG